MKGLLIKDLYNLRKYSRTLLMVLIFYLVFGVVTSNITFVTGMVIILCAMLPINVMSFDERSKWERYALSMPTGRKMLVLEKYLLSLGFVIVGALISLVASVITSLASPGVNLQEQIFAIVGVMGIGLLYVAITLFFSFKLGVERCRMIYPLIFLIPFFGGFFAIKYQLFTLTEAAVIRLVKGLPVIGLVGMVVSFFISYTVYLKRDL